MEELIILMGWHEEADPVHSQAFEANRASFNVHNPEFPLIIVMNLFEGEKAWLSTDICAFDWYAKNSAAFRAKRYLIVEWDCWCDANLADYYRRVWDCDLVAPCIKYPERDDWFWFRTIHLMPPKAREFATGVVPLCGILLSDSAMQRISDEILKPEYAHLNSELRLPTIATMLGIHPVANPVYSRNITWKDISVKSPAGFRGLHHPRKKLEQ